MLRPDVLLECVDSSDADGSSVATSGRRNRLFTEECRIDRLLIGTAVERGASFAPTTSAVEL